MISLMTTQDVTPYMDEGKPYHIYQYRKDYGRLRNQPWK